MNAMVSHRRPHPLQTFRFWFFVFGAVAVTLVWRFELLPFQLSHPETGRKQVESFTEVQLAEPTVWEEPTRRPPQKQTLVPRPPLFEADVKSFRDASFLAREVSQPSEVTEPSSIAWDAPALQAPFDGPETAHASATSPLPVPEITPASSEAPVYLALSEPPAGPTSGVLQIASTSDPAASGETPPPQLAEPAAAPSATAPDMSDIDRLTQSNDVVDHIEAHRELSRLYWQQPESRGAIRERIEALAQRIYFSPQTHYMPAHEIQSGDRLQTIAQQYGVPWQYLAKLNRVEPERVRAGQRIKVIKGPFSAVIDLSDYEITVHAHGYFVTRYPVGIGQDGSTPLGAFTVENKLVDPTYYGPDGVIEHDDPSNPLGERWIDIGNSYGIHGTIEPDSIGQSLSRGCIRMHNDDVAAVYDLLTIGSEVTIRE
jgi:lipoprotein-anchoring transpeptidase ErfK/SrfK